MQKKILVVDDDEDILESLKVALEIEGYTVQTSISGDCFQHLNGYVPDLILLDILLSGEDGREICMRLKQHKETRDIPIVLYSAHVTGDIITYLSGASTFLAKPFELHELIAIVARYTTSIPCPTPSALAEPVLSESARDE